VAPGALGYDDAMRWALAFLLLVGCLPDTSGYGEGDLDGGAVDGGAVDGGGASDGGVADGASSGADGGGTVDGGTGRDAARPVDLGEGTLGPAQCVAVELPCLDASRPDVVEVPTEATAAALASASPGTIVQVRGATLTGLHRVAPLVTVRGCEGATLAEAGTLWPSQGSGATIEGFRIAGDVFLNQTGYYVVRNNVFVGRTGSEPSIDANSRDALVSADVEVLVEANHFEGVPAGIVLSTRYDTMTHAVTADVRNNLFTGVAAPITVSEAGLVGEIQATLQHNTFHAFDVAIDFFGIDNRPRVDGNLFVTGETGVRTDGIYDGAGNMASGVTQPAAVPPVGGSIPTIDPPFVDEGGGDFRLAPGSLAIDAVAGGSVDQDLGGCPRPVAFGPGAARADVGAYEARR